jgi:hypothetical protein
MILVCTVAAVIKDPSPLPFKSATAASLIDIASLTV